jgi:hypothetical protein
LSLCVSLIPRWMFPWPAAPPPFLPCWWGLWCLLLCDGGCLGPRYPLLLLLLLCPWLLTIPHRLGSCRYTRHHHHHYHHHYMTHYTA